MSNLFKKLFGQQVTLRNDAGLNQQQLEILGEDFAQLAQVDRTLPPRALTYVVDGDDTAAVRAMQKAGTGEALLIRALQRHWSPRDDYPRDRLFGRPGRLPADVWLRLARVWEAAALSDPKAQRTRLAWSPNLPSWFDVFLWEATHNGPHVHAMTTSYSFSVDLFEQMFALDESPAETLYRAGLLCDLRSGWCDRAMGDRIVDLAGFGAHAFSFPQIVLAALSQENLQYRIRTLNALTDAKAATPEVLDRLVDMATGAAKTIRQEAERLLQTTIEPATTKLKDIAAGGTAPQRRHAVELLHRFDAQRHRAFLKERRDCETSAKVKSTIDNWLSLTSDTQPDTPEAAATENPGLPVELPPIKPVNPIAPLPRETLAAIIKLFEQCNVAAHEYCELMRRKPQGYHSETTSLDRKAAEQAFEHLQDLCVDKVELPRVIHRRFLWHECRELLDAFFARPELQLIHVIRLLLLTGDCCRAPNQRRWWFGPAFEHHIDIYFKTHKQAPSLREQAAVLETIGIDREAIALGILSPCGYWTGGDAEGIFHYFVERLDLLERLFGLRRQAFELPRFSEPEYRQRAFHILAMFPQPPASFLPLLWDIALGDAKAERPLAQKCLGRAADRDARILKALTSGKWSTRAVAAEWLARLQPNGAIAAITKAIKIEKHDAAKAAMADALETLGVPVDEFLDRAGLLRQSEQLLAKGKPKELAWFPFETLPAVHWADNGEPVAPAILCGLLVQSCKLKSPEPSAMLRRYASFFRPDEAAELGQFIVEAWIGHDTIPMTATQAKQRAQQEAQYLASYGNQSFAELYEECLQAFLQAPGGSAIKAKGILAVAGATCSGTVARPIERYVREWYGMRAHQCKALLAMLAWVDDPLAIQVLLSISNRFRTVGIRKEADRCVNELAQRKNWTRDELADRTIPDCGFDDDCTLELDYGQRRFTARMGDDFKLQLFDADGKQIKALPAARKTEDEEQAKAAKKQLSQTKKELKAVVRLQTERLYEAMCTQRTWPLADWKTYLSSHPIMGRLCQRLVWTARDGDRVAALFRPLNDGSRTDANDDPVTCPDDATIALAHCSQLSPEESQQWLTHLADYEVPPLFAQFGQERFTLPEDRRDAEELDEFTGHMIEAFALRGHATKLGYTRGPAEDAGWFFAYHKHFPSLGIEAVLNFSGNGLPEENRTVALNSLAFERKTADTDEPSFGPRRDKAVALSALPPVLLAECWNDLRTIAAAGNGYDPDWEKKVY